MNGHQFAYSSAPLKRVKYVQFGILSPEEIVCCVFLYESAKLSFCFLFNIKSIF
jgi:hypothetical protein